jgi:hypothetical protein
VINFADFTPDQPAFENAGVVEAKNVIPAVRGYRSLKNIAPVSGAATNNILGMFAGKDDDGNSALYVGDKGKLYIFDTTDSSLADKSVGGGYSTSGTNIWRFVQFGETLLATNFDNQIQTSAVAAGGNFANLSGTPPRAKFIAIVRDQVMVGYTNDSSDGTKPYRLWWSAINSATGWTPGTNLSDFQDVADLGDCTGLVGGEYAIALFERGIVRGQFVGAPLIYQFEKIITSRGCAVPGSVASIGAQQVFFLSDDGFYMLSGADLVPIGAEKINDFFFRRLKHSERGNMRAAIDPLQQIVIWAYPSVDSVDGTNDELLIYNHFLNKWSRAVVDCDTLAPLFTGGHTLEQLDAISSSIDSLPASLDDGMFTGGSFFFAASKDKKIQSFTGTTLPAVIDTGEFQVETGRRSIVNTVIPYVSGGTIAPTISAKVGSRTLQHEGVTFTAASAINSEGFCPVRSEGRFHRIRLELSDDWRQAQGVDVDAQATGLR